MTAYQLVNGDVTADSTEITTERLGTSSIEEGGEVILGDVLIFNADTVDNYNY